MSTQIEISKKLIRYLETTGYRSDKVIDQLVAETSKLGGVAQMQIAPEQGQFLEIIVKISQAKNCLEIGRFTGLSSLCIAKGLPVNGKIIAVDNSDQIVKYGKNKAKKNGLTNLEFRQGDLQNPPIENNSVDLAILSQALHHAENPFVAIEQSFRIIKPGGQIMVLDLMKHKFDKAKELFGDRWLGFDEGELHQWLESAGFREIEVSVVAREEEEPYFETLLASAIRPA